LQCVAVCCSVLQRVAVCCSVGIAYEGAAHEHFSIGVSISVLQCVAVCSSVMQCETYL